MSKPITVSIPHQLGVAEAHRRIDDGFVKLIGQAGAVAKVDRQWAGERMTFAVQTMGQTISGHLDVGATAIDLEIQLPMFLAMIADKLKGRLRKEGQLLLK